MGVGNWIKIETGGLETALSGNKVSVESEEII